VRRGLMVAMVGGWMLACGSGEAVTAPDAPTDKAPEAAPEKAPEAAAAKQGKLVSLEQGDVACYVELKGKGGEELYLHGDFELCPGGGSDASKLVGQRVAYTTVATQVQADTCEGNPDCSDTQEVPLVLTLTAAK